MYAETFKDLSDKRKETVRTTVAQLHKAGWSPEQISKKVKVGYRSIATLCGNLTRKVTTTKSKKRQK